MRARLVVADRVSTPAGTQGDAILIRDGCVAEIGTAARLRRPGLAEDRYPGAVIVPGLRDAHFHPVPYASALSRLSVGSASDLDQLLRLVQEAASQLPPGRPLIGTRLDDEALAERRLPTRIDLDRAAAGRPVLLHRYCGHIAVASTAALELAGVTPQTPDPPGGSLDRDEDGLPSGVLRETAVGLVAPALGGRTEGPDPEAVLEALRGLPTLGLTSIGAIVSMGSGPWCESGDELATVIEIARRLPLRLAVLVIADHPDSLEQAASQLAAAGPRLRFLGVKEFADGSLGGHTAALAEPYHDRPGTTGTLRLEGEAVRLRARAALRLGGKVAVHAIGDLANARVLDLFDGMLAEGADPADLRVEHASILGSEEIDRFSSTGIIASVQPAFLASEAGWLEKRLGPERLARAYPLATLASRGVPLAGGSDSPVEPPHPLWGMAAARHRPGLVPDQELSAGQALRLFTDGAALALGEPPPLQVGSPADFTVLDRDPVGSTADQLRNSAVLATWIDGESVPFPEEPTVWTA